MIRINVGDSQKSLSTTEYTVWALPELQKYNLKKMLKKGDIKLNGCLVKKDYAVEPGDVIEVYLPAELEKKPTLDICYEDKNIIVLNKKPGVCQTEENNKSKWHSLTSMVADHMMHNGEYYEELGCIPFSCYHLDMYTGGLAMFAKNGDTFEAIRMALRQRQIIRRFQAIVAGKPEYNRGELQHFYVKEKDGNYRIAATNVKGAIPIYSRYAVLRTNGEFSLIEIEPVTGHVNQERAHIEAAGCSILGDAVYGDVKLNKKMGIRYQALWATEIEFNTGVNNLVAYLNGLRIETDDIRFPLVNI